MKIADICKLIITCRKNGITELSYNGLNIKLGSQRNESDHSNGNLHGGVFEQLPLTPDDGDKIKIFDQSIEDDAEQMDLMLSDPHGYETSLMDRFIDRERKPHD